MTRASPTRLLRDTGVISHDPAGECSLHYRNVSKSPRATRGPLYKRGLLGPLLYQRRDREDFASSIATLPLSPGAAVLHRPSARSMASGCQSASMACALHIPIA